MGVEGEAIVESIDDCLEFETGSGRVITAAFAHFTGEWSESISTALHTVSGEYESACFYRVVAEIHRNSYNPDLGWTLRATLYQIMRYGPVVAT